MTVRLDAAITLLVEPARTVLPPSPGAIYTSPRDWAKYDLFAKALAEHVPAPVVVVEGFLRDAPKGLVLLHYNLEFLDAFRECADAGEPDVARRVFLLNVRPSMIEENLDASGVAGAISVARYWPWRLGRDEHERAELYGLRGLPPEPSLRVVRGLVETARYATYEGEQGESLPAFLARYLAAYWPWAFGGGA